MTIEENCHLGSVREVALLTGGGDRPYALGLAACLIAEGIRFDFISSDELASSELDESPLVRVLNLRGETSRNAPLPKKIVRVLIYYARLLQYAWTAKPPVFHILWNNKVEMLDRTLLLVYYKFLGKRLVHTVHNVNARKRDGTDNAFNRWTLKIQYQLSDHLFVHTQQMQQELTREFGVPVTKITLIPFGINDTVPKSEMTRADARSRLDLEPQEKTILFFGNIAPYKGLEYLVDAFALISKEISSCRLIIAGRIKGSEKYWQMIQEKIESLSLKRKLIQRIDYVPDEEIETYFKAADVAVLPYTSVFQSGVLFLAYSFGLPVIASDVGSLNEDIVEGKTGFVCAARDAYALADKVQQYFHSELYRSLERNRVAIERFASDRYSWDKVGVISKKVYGALLSAEL